MAWDFKSDRSIYLQLVDHFKVNIISGELLPGAKIASVRDLAAEASVNPNTMQRALTELERLGLVYTQRTNGRFITEDLKVIEAAKSNFAKEHINELISRMQMLGLNKKQIIELIEKSYKEEL
ncbi:MAG: GntR family transcriptional regulator [Oscillospiraceae bacterium]